MKKPNGYEELDDREKKAIKLWLIIPLLIVFIFIPLKIYDYKDAQNHTLGKVTKTNTSCEERFFYPNNKEWSHKRYTVCINFVKVEYEEKIYDFKYLDSEDNFEKYEVGGLYNFKKPFTFIPIDTDRNYIVTNKLLKTVVSYVTYILFFLCVLLGFLAEYQLEMKKLKK